MKDLIQQMVKDMMPIYLLRGTVTAVDMDQFTIDVDPLSGDAEVLDVKLRVIIDNQEAGVILFPEVGAEVLLGMVSKTDAYLLSASKLQKLVITMEGFRLEVDGHGNAVFNDGSNQGMVKLPELQAQIAKNSAFLTTIRSTFASWVPVPSDGGASLKTVMTAALNSLQTADLSNAGNDKIKH